MNNEKEPPTPFDATGPETICKKHKNRRLLGSVFSPLKTRNDTVGIVAE